MGTHTIACESLKPDVMDAIRTGIRSVSEDTLTFLILYSHGLIHPDLYEIISREAIRRDIEEGPYE